MWILRVVKNSVGTQSIAWCWSFFHSPLYLEEFEGLKKERFSQSWSMPAWTKNDYKRKFVAQDRWYLAKLIIGKQWNLQSNVLSILKGYQHNGRNTTSERFDNGFNKTNRWWWEERTDNEEENLDKLIEGIT